jgi:tRNA dimethylallyltransferase
MSDCPAAPLIALMGPTASGKSALAMELAMTLEGQGIPCEIVTADSMQVYRGMDIGTAKPDPRDRARVPHHLIDLVKPTENFNVSQYRALASPLLDRLIGEGKAVLVAGGTGLYIKALIDGLNDAPEADSSLRERLEAEAAERGGEALYNRLKRVDPEAAEKIHPHNIRRVIRALEVFEASGKPFSKFHLEQKPPRWQPWFHWVGLLLPFETLDERIEKRTARMFEQGLVDEVKGLLAMGCNAGHTSMQGLGYKEVAWGLANGASENEMRQMVAQRTRRYARRQMTWWRPEKRLRWIQPEAGESALGLSRRVIELVGCPDSLLE